MLSAKASKTEIKNIFFLNIKNFPSVENGRINLVKFLEASTDLVSLVERLGTAFAPVKYDMQGNIDKIKKNFKYDDSSCLLELMLMEVAAGGSVVTEGVLWLNRALLFFELAFLEILRHIKMNNYNVSMTKIFTTAYEGSVKKYHNWVTQHLFNFICKMSPSLPQIIKSVDIQDDMLNDFETKLENLNETISLNRCRIDDFFKDNNLLEKLKA